MVGLRQVATRPPPIAAKSLENMSMKPFGCISLMSAPAANAFSLPVSRMQPIVSSASRPSTAAAISRNTPNDSALSIFGRFSVMTPTAPLLSTMMCSNVAMITPALRFGGQCARGRRQRQQGAEGDEDLANQRRLVQRGTVVSVRIRRRSGGRGQYNPLRRRRDWLFGRGQRPVDVVVLIGSNRAGLSRRLRIGRLVSGGLQDGIGLFR